MDGGVLQAEVPVLSIQPLVENAVKHGVAPRRSAGFVRLSIRKQARNDSRSRSPTRGLSGEPARSGGAKASGLSNVRRRLALCYGEESKFDISSANDMTAVRFSLPCAAVEQSGPLIGRLKFVRRGIASGCRADPRTALTLATRNARRYSRAYWSLKH